MIRSRIVLHATALVLALLMLPETMDIGAQPITSARVRFAHMSPEAPPLDVQVDGQATVAGLAFKGASGYMALSAGTHMLRVAPASGGQSPLASTELLLSAGQDLTLVVVGQRAEVGILPLPDDNAPPPLGKSKVRFVHAVPDAPAVDIAVRGGAVLWPNVAFRNVAGYTAVDPGAYALDLRPVGAPAAVFTASGLSLQAGQIVTVFATGLVATNSLSSVVVPYAAAGATTAMPQAGVGVPLGKRTPGMPWLGVLVVLIILGVPVVVRHAQGARAA